ncbi:flagellar biosynthesis protein FliQ [Pelagibaculum spongiae]|uniref:Flagellar biosynthetic protein FliQ n=2 Tax=Pelagibaculum spongiae TaxID=2080658 RepID=A0A2V1GY73_9GAMM|nr:flagellar biosynthesis protein FliQ [Pelagibaculum spongiae]PVZ66713.1 flagellar biosynthetic protein FliQ [Pelagibaculum spongiae]
MNEGFIDLFRESLMVVVSATAVVIIPGLLVGLLVAVFQAATSINEQTLSFVPKLFVTLMMIGLAGPWLLRLFVEFARQVFTEIPGLIG